MQRVRGEGLCLLVSMILSVLSCAIFGTSLLFPSWAVRTQLFVIVNDTANAEHESSRRFEDRSLVVERRRIQVTDNYPVRVPTLKPIINLTMIRVKKRGPIKLWSPEILQISGDESMKILKSSNEEKSHQRKTRTSKIDDQQHLRLRSKDSQITHDDYDMNESNMEVDFPDLRSTTSKFPRSISNEVPNRSRDFEEMISKEKLTNPKFFLDANVNESHNLKPNISHVFRDKLKILSNRKFTPKIRSFKKFNGIFGPNNSVKQLQNINLIQKNSSFIDNSSILPRNKRYIDITNINFAELSNNAEVDNNFRNINPNNDFKNNIDKFIITSYNSNKLEQYNNIHNTVAFSGIIKTRINHLITNGTSMEQTKTMENTSLVNTILSRGSLVARDVEEVQDKNPSYESSILKYPVTAVTNTSLETIERMSYNTSYLKNVNKNFLKHRRDSTKHIKWKHELGGHDEYSQSYYAFSQPRRKIEKRSSDEDLHQQILLEITICLWKICLVDLSREQPDERTREFFSALIEVYFL